MHLRAAVAQPAGDPEAVAEAVGQFAETGNLALVCIAVETLIIFIRQSGQPACRQIFGRGAIGKIHRASFVIIEETRHPLDRARGARDQPAFLDEQVIIAIGVQRKGESLGKGPGQIDIEGCVISRQCRRADQLGEIELIVDRGIVIGELALKQIGTIGIAHELAEIRIGQSRIRRLAVLIGRKQLHLHPVARLQQQGSAAAIGLQAVRIVDAGADIVDPAVLVAVIAGDAKGSLVGHQRDVDHRVVALADRTGSGQTDVDAGRRLEIVEIGAPRDDPHRTGERVRAEQRTLRPSEKLDPLDVIKIGIENGRIAIGRNRQFVDIDGDRALQPGAVAVGVDATGGEIIEILRRPVDDDARRVLRDAFEPDDAQIIQFLLVEGRDAERNILEPHGATGGGDDDFLVPALLILCGAVVGCFGRLGQDGLREQGDCRRRREKYSFHLNLSSKPVLFVTNWDCVYATKYRDVNTHYHVREHLFADLACPPKSGPY